MLREFVAEARGQLDELQAAVSAKDCDQSRRIGHALRGVSANVCAEGMSQVAEEIEAAGDKKELKPASILAARLERELTLVKDAVGALSES